MKDNNSLWKGTLSTIILKLLSDHPQMYGYEISRKVKEITAGNIQLTEGALYPALHKLESEGFIESSLEQVGNRPRKYYRLTETGSREKTVKLDALESFLKDIHLLFNVKPRMA